jgi:hypothetical protein
MVVPAEALPTKHLQPEAVEAVQLPLAKVVALPTVRQEKERKDEEIAVLSLLLF